MNYAFTRCHPLDVSWTNQSPMASEIFMVHLSFQHVGYCLEASMRVIGEPSRKFNFEEVKHKERIKVVQVLVSDDPGDSSTFSFTLLLWLKELLNRLQSD
jgi:hypothetical protein